MIKQKQDQTKEGLNKKKYQIRGSFRIKKYQTGRIRQKKDQIKEGLDKKKYQTKEGLDVKEDQTKQGLDKR